MRRAAVISFVAVASFALAFTFAAAGGDHGRGIDVSAANQRTARVGSVHETVTVTLTRASDPQTLTIRSGSSAGKLDAHVSVGAMSGTIRMDKPFLYESAPKGIVVLGNVSWLRLHTTGLAQDGQVMSTLRSLTPMPLLHVIAEAKLHPLASRGVFGGTVAYDDPVVRTALRDLAAGFEFRGLRLRVVVGRDGLIHSIHLTGRTADGKTGLSLRARLFGFNTPVRVKPPAPGTFMDPALEQVQA
jgi:hypothetical protein